jgi:hypothetical protein
MTTAIAAAVASGDMLTMSVVDQILKEITAKPTAEHLRRPNFKTANRKQMFDGSSLKSELRERRWNLRK